LPEDQLLHLIRSRRSVRHFQARPVPPAVLDSILQAALSAPSAHNSQPWRFAVIQSPPLKLRLAESLAAAFRRDLTRDGLAPPEITAQVDRSRRRIQAAPLLIVLCLDTSSLQPYPDPVRSQAEHTMAVQGVAMAGLSLMLAAYALGLGAVWICAPLFAPQAVSQALELPGSWQPQGMLLAGYPTHIPPSRSRRPLTELARYD
jgi:coenzyme F420-0:L-glutamate ligase/coenzyme F420-1:gamma-L-glutamate ligase